MRFVWKIEPLASLDDDAIVAAIAPTIQRYLDSDVYAATCKAPPAEWRRDPGCHGLGAYLVRSNLGLAQGDKTRQDQSPGESRIQETLETAWTSASGDSTSAASRAVLGRGVRRVFPGQRTGVRSGFCWDAKGEGPADGQAREARRVRSCQRARPVNSRRAIRATQLSHGCPATSGTASIQAWRRHSRRASNTRAPTAATPTAKIASRAPTTT